LAAVWAVHRDGRGLNLLLLLRLVSLHGRSTGVGLAAVPILAVRVLTITVLAIPILNALTAETRRHAGKKTRALIPEGRSNPASPGYSGIRNDHTENKSEKAGFQYLKKVHFTLMMWITQEKNQRCRCPSTSNLSLFDRSCQVRVTARTHKSRLLSLQEPHLPS